MSKRITLEDLILIFGEGCIPPDIDKKILMKHLDIIMNRIIGKKTVEKLREALSLAIENTKNEQQRERGKVIESPVDLTSPTISIKPSDLSIAEEKEEKIKERTTLKTVARREEKEDKYGLKSIREGLVSQRLKRQGQEIGKTKEEEVGEKAPKQTKPLTEEEKSLLPSVEDLTVLSGGRLSRTQNVKVKKHVQREIAIREYQVVDESRSPRWGKASVMNHRGEPQEISQPAYIFHSDLWQLENAREPNVEQQCDILSHVVLDMVANNINVVMLDDESEPFFIVEGQGLLHSKDTLKDKVTIHAIVHLILISCEAWQIALKRPEALIKGRDISGHERMHQIDMTSVIPLADIRSRMSKLDSEFRRYSDQPNRVITKAYQTLANHRKNVIWSCGAPIIANLREAMKEHRKVIQKKGDYFLNIVVIGTRKAIHPVQIKYSPSGKFEINELYPGYCQKHSILDLNTLRTIFGSIPAIYDSQSNNKEDDLVKIAHAVHQRIAYSAQENLFDPGYIKGIPSEMIPISKLDIILPPKDSELERKLERAGFILD